MKFVLKEVDKKHLTLLPGGGGEEEQPEYDENPWETPPDPEPQDLGVEPDFDALQTSLSNIGDNIRKKMLFKLVKNEET
jgi:hypothetical protein